MNPQYPFLEFAWRGLSGAFTALPVLPRTPPRISIPIDCGSTHRRYLPQCAGLWLLVSSSQRAPRTRSPPCQRGMLCLLARGRILILSKKRGVQQGTSLPPGKSERQLAVSSCTCKTLALRIPDPHTRGGSRSRSRCTPAFPRDIERGRGLRMRSSGLVSGGWITLYDVLPRMAFHDTRTHREEKRRRGEGGRERRRATRHWVGLRSLQASTRPSLQVLYL